MAKLIQSKVGAQQFGALDQLPPPLKFKGLVIWTNPKAESFVWQTAASRIQHEDFLKTWEVHHMVFRAETLKMPKLLRKVAGEYIFRMSGLCCYHKDLRQGTLQKEAYLIDDLGSQKSKISFWLRTFYYIITWQMTSWWECMLRVKITWWDKKPGVGRREASSLLILVEWILQEVKSKVFRAWPWLIASHQAPSQRFLHSSASSH